MNIIVTGASSGIGYDSVKTLAMRGGNSIIAIARRQDLLQNLIRECEQYPSSEVTALPFDIQSEDFSKLNEYVNDKFTGIDILLNNAGLLISKPFEKLTKMDAHDLYNTNFYSVVKIIQELLPLFNAPSHIVNISSMGGFQGSAKFPGLSVYSATKAAVACLTESLAEEFGPLKISVNCLALGAVQTQMLEKAFPEYKANLSSSEMSSFIADFCLNGSKYFNGKILPVSISTP
ncbi:MAG: SDR family oxidoreductase [Bacteroidetes bacterium]|nr:SDR family oxidoreductase [Bacteroidota bacterium]HET6245712.1 SDR family oxidoreductase [Bacteroidia bacterium]